jgi:MFS superfamily sulfate permease-like transporter
MWFRHDLAAGLSVFLVALPLCLGIALASGAPLYAGLLSGIIGGLVVALISGSSLAVSGPAAGLTTLVAAGISSAGNYRVFLLTIIIAGLFQLLLGLLKLGVIANYFPSAVIKGMLAAIGIMLIAKQIPLALGYDKPDFWTSGFLTLFSYDNFTGNLSRFSHHISPGAILITVISLAIMILIQRSVIKTIRAVPAPLIVVLAGIGLNFLFTSTGSSWALSPQQLVNIPSNIFASMQFPDLSQLFVSGQIWKDGILIGLLATLETLLCIEAVDKLDRHNRITPVNRELVAQGVGNMACGFLGAIPLTAVVVRGAANVDAGARTKLSAVTHGAFLLLAVLLIPSVLNKIPYASLGGILLVTGYNLAKPKLFKNMRSLGWKQFLPFLITIIIILSTDLLIGVSIGLLLSVYFIIQNNFKAEYKITRSHHLGKETELIKLNSNVTFLNKVKLKKTLDEVPENTVLTIDGSECNFIDYDILEIISEYDNKARDRNIELHLKGIKKVSVTAVH